MVWMFVSIGFASCLPETLLTFDCSVSCSWVISQSDVVTDYQGQLIELDQSECKTLGDTPRLPLIPNVTHFM